MKTNHILIALVLFAALLLIGCGAKETPPLAVPQGAQAGDLVDLQPCTYKAGEREYSADCGTLVVPENRSDPNSRLIALPVIRVRARSESPVEPIFYLQGGPGGTNQHFQYLDGLVDDHDFIQVGYRGVDGSVLLDCPEIAEAVRNAPDVLGDASLDNYTDASARCATRLEAEGVDLAGYTMTEVIDDMEAARLALGYKRINLLGESYGSRLEMIYEWMYPERLNRVVMVAVNPPGHFLWEPKNIDAQLGDYAELCARDTKCSSHTDDLMASLRHVSENIPERWLFFPIDPGGVKMVSFFSLMESIQPPGVPVPLSGPAMIDMWLAAEKGDASGMALVSLTRNMFLPNLSVYGDLLAKGGSGGDFEGRAGPRTQLDPPGSILGSPLSLYHSAMASSWPHHLIPEQYLPVQATDVETLLVSGSIDFSTPPQFATQELLPYLKNGDQVILKDFGHTETFWYSQAEARLHLLNTFLDTGEVDDSLYTYQPVNFDPGLGWPGLAKVLLGTVLAVIILLVALVWFVVRRVRRRRTIRSASDPIGVSVKTLSQPVFRYSLLAVLFAVVPNLVGAVIAFLLFTFLGWLDLPNGSVLLYWRQAIGLTLTFLPVLAATLAWARFRERQPVDLRLQGSTTTRFAVGAIAGLAMCAGMVVLLVTPGGATFERTVAASSPLVTVALLAAMMGILIQTGAEEVIFRGWLLSRLQNTLTPTRAAIVSSLVFAAVHLFTNPSVMAFIGLFLYGVLLAMVRLHGGGLAAAIGWHWAWNFSESALFGVSERTASSISTAVIGSITDTGNPLWSGGMHGTNSGLAMTLVLAAGCLLFATKLLVAKSRVLDSHGAA